MTACLIPLAVTNLRARVSDRLTATDASSWGEAAVCAKLPRRVAEELYRHTLRKSVWARLLAPAAAWERTHGLLAPDKELPEGVERYRSNPLWEHLACCLEYRFLLSGRRAGSATSMSASLRQCYAQKRFTPRRGRSRGRSTAWTHRCASPYCRRGAPPRLLSTRPLSGVSPTCWRSMCMQRRSTSTLTSHENRADDPTRGRPVREPSRAVPDWWSSLSGGRFDEFDCWLQEHGLDPASIGGLPPFSELDPRLEGGAGPVLAAMPARPVLHEPAPPGVNAEAPSSPETAGCSLSPVARDLLGRFPRDQVVGLRCEEPWPPLSPGYLDLFSGERGAARALARLSRSWVLCFDLAHDASEDLSDWAVQWYVEEMIRRSCFGV